MKNEFLSVVKYMAEHGELMKAYLYLRNAPAYFDNDPELISYMGILEARLRELKQMQDKGTVFGKFNSAFQDPKDVKRLVCFQLFKKRVMELKLKRLVDVGCYTGWIGRELSKEGVAVHGIDVQPVIIQLAALYASGSLATFEFLPVQQLGAAYTKQFDGAILFDVLEHTFDPELAIDSVNRATKGWVFVNLPHPKGEQESDPYPIEEHEHLYSFSESDVMRLFPTATKEIVHNEGGTINWFIQYQT